MAAGGRITDTHQLIQYYRRLMVFLALGALAVLLSVVVTAITLTVSLDNRETLEQRTDLFCDIHESATPADVETLACRDR